MLLSCSPESLYIYGSEKWLEHVTHCVQCSIIHLQPYPRLRARGAAHNKLDIRPNWRWRQRRQQRQSAARRRETRRAWPVCTKKSNWVTLASVWRPTSIAWKNSATSVPSSKRFSRRLDCSKRKSVVWRRRTKWKSPKRDVSSTRRRTKTRDFNSKRVEVKSSRASSSSGFPTRYRCDDELKAIGRSSNERSSTRNTNCRKRYEIKNRLNGELVTWPACVRPRPRCFLLSSTVQGSRYRVEGKRWIGNGLDQFEGGARERSVAQSRGAERFGNKARGVRFQSESTAAGQKKKDHCKKDIFIRFVLLFRSWTPKQLESINSKTSWFSRRSSWIASIEMHWTPPWLKLESRPRRSWIGIDLNRRQSWKLGWVLLGQLGIRWGWSNWGCYRLMSLLSSMKVM